MFTSNGISRVFARPSSAMAALLSAALLLSACGGGGGAGAADSAAAAEASPPTSSALASGMLAVTVPQGMVWTLDRQRALTVRVLGPDGHPVSDVAISVHTAGVDDPHTGQPLDEAVPLEAIDSAMTDTAGNVVLALRLPNHVDDVLVTASHDGQAARARVQIGQGATEATLRLVR